MLTNEQPTLSADLRDALHSVLTTAPPDQGASEEEAGVHAALTAALEGEHPADIADAMEELSDGDALRIFAVLDVARAAEVLDELDTDKARYLLDHDVPGRIAALLDILPMDDAAEVLAEAASPKRQEAILADLFRRSPEDAAEVRELLSYPPGSAGRLMTDRFVRLRAEMTVDEAFAAVRYADPEVETLNDLYVTVPSERAGEEILTGVLSLRELVRQPGAQLVRDFMTTDLVSVRTDTDQEEVARLISKYDFLALPVLDAQGFLAGIITIDDVLDVLVQEQTEDLLKQGGISTEPGVLNMPYFSVPLWRVVRSRVGWLVLLFVAETATGVVLRHFEDELARVVALSFFVPLLIGTGGNTGAQTVSTIIRGLALNEIRGRDTGRVVLRELGSGVLLGLILGTIAFCRALLWHSGLQLSLVVALTIVVICTWANTIGSLIPLLAQRLRIDPALVSAPLITTLVDATGLAIYLTIAKLLISALH